jgi:hypothetical protein
MLLGEVQELQEFQEFRSFRNLGGKACGFGKGAGRMGKIFTLHFAPQTSSSIT